MRKPDLEQGLSKIEWLRLLGVGRGTIHRGIRTGQLERDVSAAGARPSNDRLRGAGVRRRASESPRAFGLSASGRVARRLPGQREPVAVDRDLAPPLAYRKPLRRAALALLALIVALAANPAAAQTSITLVSNTNQTGGGTGNLQDFDQAQAFTTGGHAAGYALTGVDIQFGAVASATASYAVAIRTDASGSPGASVGALTGPATLVANAVNAYTTAGIELAADTTYFVLVDSSSTAVNRVQNTASDNEDSGGQSGWSIADGSVYRNRDDTGGWTDFGESKKIAIKGYAKAQPTLVSNTGQNNDDFETIGFDELRPGLRHGKPYGRV